MEAMDVIGYNCLSEIRCIFAVALYTIYSVSK